MAESQGNLQVSRLYEMTDDRGVRDMLSFNLARDFMHQNQWAAAIEELQADGLEDFLVPGTMPTRPDSMDQAHTFWNCSAGTESGQGRWAQGPTMDGIGEFQYSGRTTASDDGHGRLRHSQHRCCTAPRSNRCRRCRRDRTRVRWQTGEDALADNETGSRSRAQRREAHRT